jgi:hypothetical protein
MVVSDNASSLIEKQPGTEATQQDISQLLKDGR